jgi:hypothetical protein
MFFCLDIPKHRDKRQNQKVKTGEKQLKLFAPHLKENNSSRF